MRASPWPGGGGAGMGAMLMAVPAHSMVIWVLGRRPARERRASGSMRGR